MAVKVELLEGITSLLTESVDVTTQVSSDIVWVSQELGEVEFARVVKPLLGDSIQNRVKVLELTVEVAVFNQHSVFGWSQDAIQTTKQHERKDDSSIFGGLVVTSQ